ncbi:hypothetical protein [Flavimaricola marinus]|uniref:Sulfotransferase family protein n=1 Tax=Flavimaricola marinus TaxID=1819565 RepID=A0A238L986_9RHOB|nr:hypothetical protein [Flavimaricola marinus]SMY06228.1 hypothetical protein LOM8899_00351 [Flavimaricola marinus]
MADTRPRRILIHPGFHKTGTSSIQHFLWTNRALLSDTLAVLQLRHLKPAAQLCMSYSRNSSPLLLADLVGALTEAIEEHGPVPDSDDTRDIVVSCEALSGHCPGWPGVDNYAAAPFTASVLAGFFGEVFPGSEVLVVYSTREQDSWLHSAWRHHLLGQRLMVDYETWAPRYRVAADLMPVVIEVAEGLAPVRVFTLPLEESHLHPQGPGGALLELIDLPDDLRRRLQPVGHGNPGPKATLAREYLALNRSALTDSDVKNRKDMLADQAKVGGWATASHRT